MFDHHKHVFVDQYSLFVVALVLNKVKRTQAKFKQLVTAPITRNSENRAVRLA